MTTAFGAAGDAKYVLLTTYRKDGTPVGSPLWAALDGDKMVLWTPTDSWKVKRIRRNPSVTIQPCTIRGQVSGDIVTGTAELAEGVGVERVRSLIRSKYGITGWLTITGSLLRRGKSGTCGIIVSRES